MGRLPDLVLGSQPCSVKDLYFNAALTRVAIQILTQSSRFLLLIEDEIADTC